MQYKKMFFRRKAQVMIYITFFIAAILIILIAAVLAPFGVLFNSKMYEAGEELLLDANSTITDIDNAAVEASLRGTIEGALGETENNIDINADLFKYSWIVVIVLTALVIFIFTRRLVEYGQGGFV